MKKSSHTDMHELWERLKSAGHLILTLIGGLTVISGAFYAVYEKRDIFGFESSELEFRPLASTKFYLLFLVENNGNKPASIGRVTGQFNFIGSESSVYSAPLRLDVIEYEEGKTIIAPGKFEKLRVYIANQERLYGVLGKLSGVGELKSARCKFDFEIINFDGSQEVKGLQFDCEEYAGEYLRMRNTAKITIGPGE